jgi:uncharacterized protein
MASVFLQLARKVLEIEKRPLTINEIWEIGKERGFDKELTTSGKTPWATLSAMVHVDVRDNPKSLFLATGARPNRFVLKSLIESNGEQVLDILPPEEKRQKTDYLEKSLHPFMVYYGFYYLKAYLKTIRHTKSDKREFGEWVHPDIIGCYFSFSDWKDEVVEVSTLTGNASIKLYSFELKRELSLSNLREAFFQAVSNSSWANEGYLVAADIDNDEEFQNELKRLSTSFGIGVIKIDVNEPDSTEVIFPARSKDLVDWETVNKLAGMNPDFLEFLKRVKVDMSSREIRKEMYDHVLEREELIKSIK